jgi:hypothetical protein
MAVVKNLMIRTGADMSGLRKSFSKASKDLQKFKKTVSRTMKIAAVALAGVGVKKSLDAIDYQIEQETKLAVIMRQRMNATEEMIQSVKDLTSEQQRLGVVGDEAQLMGAQELATYLEKSEAIKTLIPAMNNLVAQQYGFAASGEQVRNIATMIGKVMDGQTGALSRYGFTFSEAEEKIFKFGSEAEKSALFAKIVADSVGNMNEALANTSSGRVKQMKNAFGDLQEEIGRLILPIRDAIIPLLHRLVNLGIKAAQSMRQAFEMVGAFLHALFGTKPPSKMAAGAIENAEAIGDAYEEAGKKAAGSVAGFDEVNSLADSSAGGGSGGSAGGMFGDMTADTSVFETLSVLSAETMEKIENLANAIRGSFVDAWDKLKQAVSNVREGFMIIGTAMGDLKDNAIDKIKDGLSSFKQILEDNDTALKTTTGILLTVFGPALIITGTQAAVQATKIAATFIATIITAGIEAVVSAAKITGSFIVALVKTAAQAVVTASIITKNLIVATANYAIEGWKAAAAIAAQTAAWIVNKVQLVIATGLLIAQKVATVAATAAQWALNVALNANPIGLIIIAIAALIAIGVLLYKNWDKITAFAGKLWEGIKNAWDNIKNKTSSVFNSIRDMVKSSINHIIGFINKMINGINNIKISVPEVNIPIVGKVGGFSVGLPKIPNIPHLAKGGITNGEMMAVIGDNPGGREVVSPLDDLVDIVQTAVSSAISTSQQMGSSRGDVVLQIDGVTLARLLNPFSAKEQNRIGGLMITTT